MTVVPVIGGDRCAQVLTRASKSLVFQRSGRVPGLITRYNHLEVQNSFKMQTLLSWVRPWLVVRVFQTAKVCRTLLRPPF